MALWRMPLNLDGGGLTMATYDSKVIYRFADELYTRADAIVGQAVIIAALLIDFRMARDPSFRS